MAEKKDVWDKSEVVAKLLGVTLIPVVVAATAYFLNAQVSVRQSNTEKSKVAVDILSVPISSDEASETDPLRRWAVNALSSDFQFSEVERNLLLSGERSFPAANVPSPPVCSLTANKEVVTVGEIYEISWRGEPSAAVWKINGSDVLSEDSAAYNFPNKAYQRYVLSGTNEFGQCATEVVVHVKPTCNVTTSQHLAAKGDQYEVEWRGYPAGASSLNGMDGDIVYGFQMNGTPVVAHGKSNFTFEDTDGDGRESFTFTGRNGVSTCEQAAIVLANESLMHRIDQPCSIKPDKVFLTAGETYNVDWISREGGIYWMSNADGGLELGSLGSYEFIWSEADTIKTFEFNSLVDGEFCKDIATVYSATEEPQCSLRTDREQVYPGDEFRVSWSGYPDEHTTFRVNGALQDPVDAASYTWPIDRIEPIEFELTGHNASGTCRSTLSIKRKSTFQELEE